MPLDRPARKQYQCDNCAYWQSDFPRADATKRTKRGRDPNGRGGGQTAHAVIGLTSNNDTGTDEADTGHDALNDAAHGIGVKRAIGCIDGGEHKRRSTGCNETKGTQAGGFVVRVAIETDRTAEESGCAKTRGNIKPIEHGC